MSVAGVVIAPSDPRREAFLDALVASIAGSLAMLNTPTYGGYAVADEHLWERARALAAVLVLEYDVRALPPDDGAA